MNCIRLGVDPIGILMWKWRRKDESDKEKDYGYVLLAGGRVSSSDHPGFLPRTSYVTDGSWRDRHVLVSSKNIRT